MACREFRYPFTSPASQVWYSYFGIQHKVKFRFVNYPPSPRTVYAIVERIEQRTAKRRMNVSMRQGRARLRMELSIQDFSDEVFRQVFQVLVSRSAHHSSLVCAVQDPIESR